MKHVQLGFEPDIDDHSDPEMIDNPIDQAALWETARTVDEFHADVEKLVQ